MNLEKEEQEEKKAQKEKQAINKKLEKKKKIKSKSQKLIKKSPDLADKNEYQNPPEGVKIIWVDKSKIVT